MTSIQELAQTISETYGIDSRDAATDAVRVLVDQICDDPDLYDAETQELTTQGVEVVTEAIAVSYAKDLVSTEAGRLLQEIAEAAEAIAKFEAKVAEYTDDRDELIRAALRTELRRADIAAAAGVKEARLYQIRDGRR